MRLTGFLKIPDIRGEAKAVGHEEEIDIHSIDWNIEQSSTASPGSGRVRARAITSPIAVGKHYDASSPYLALAAMQGKAFDEVVIVFRKDSGDEPLDYLTITLSNAVLSSYGLTGEEEDAEIDDRIGMAFESIKIKYVVQADDHSAGDEHEVEFDVVAGA